MEFMRSDSIQKIFYDFQSIKEGKIKNKISCEIMDT